MNDAKRTARTPLQLLADCLVETAQTPLEMCEAEIALIEADAHAAIARTAAAMKHDVVLRKSRALKGRCTR